MKITWTSCKDCDFSQLERIPRSFWMRALPPLRNYHCNQCDSDLLARKELVEARQWMMSTFKNYPLPPAPPVPGGHEPGA